MSAGAPDQQKTAVLAAVEDLSHSFSGSRKGFRAARSSVRAVDRVSFSIAHGETLGLVGESGSGKSTIGRIVLGMLPPGEGRASYLGDDIYKLSGEQRLRFRRSVQMIFQDPLGNLDPRMRVGDQIREALDIHREGTLDARRDRVDAALGSVGLDTALGRRFPHQLSGGQLQRVVIARAMILRPELVICDEAVSALDVSVQAQVLNLLADLRDDLGLAYLFISHDLAVVRHLCDRVVVLYLGRIMEVAPTEALFGTPQHPYTRALIDAVPVPEPDPDPDAKRRRQVLNDDPPAAVARTAGCRFAPRCPLAFDRCRVEEPLLRPLGAGHHAACHLAEVGA